MSPSRSGAEAIPQCWGCHHRVCGESGPVLYTHNRELLLNPNFDLDEHLQKSSTMSSAVENPRPLPVYFISHAGVGLLFKEDENNDIVKDNLRYIGDEIRAISPPPKAILAFSGHFEAGEIHGPDVVEGQ